MATLAFGINPRGDIVGRYVAGGKNHGFLLHKGNFTAIDAPNSRGTTAFGITPGGDIAGTYTDATTGMMCGWLLSRKDAEDPDED